jgi:hypothetical protein
VNLILCLSLADTIPFYSLQLLSFIFNLIETKIIKKDLIPSNYKIKDQYTIYSNIFTA